MGNLQRALFCIVLFLLPVRLVAQSVYKVGVILPLSGPTASLGNYLKKGIDLSYAQLSPAQQKKIELLYEDDQLTAVKTAAAAQKLINVDKVQALFVLGSGSGNVVGPIADKHRVLLIAIGASDSSITKKRELAFLHWVTPATEAQKLVAEVKRRGYEKIATIVAQQEGATAIMDAVKVELKAQGLYERIVLDEELLPDARDFKSLISKASGKGVKAIVMLLYPGGTAAFAKQNKMLGLNAELIGIELFEDKNEVDASQGGLLGQWYVNADVASSWFVDLYREKYSEFPGWGAANGYDSLNLVATAVDNDGPDNVSVARYLNSVRNYSGAAGTYSATGDHRFTLPAAIKVVKEDGFEKIW